MGVSGLALHTAGLVRRYVEPAALSIASSMSTEALAPWVLGHAYTLAPALQQLHPLAVKLLLLSLYAYTAAAYAVVVLRWSRPGLLRFLLAAPLVGAHLAVGLWVLTCLLLCLRVTKTYLASRTTKNPNQACSEARRPVSGLTYETTVRAAQYNALAGCLPARLPACLPGRTPRLTRHAYVPQAPLLLDHHTEPLIITPLAGCFSLSAFKVRGRQGPRPPAHRAATGHECAHCMHMCMRSFLHLVPQAHR